MYPQAVAAPAPDLEIENGVQFLEGRVLLSLYVAEEKSVSTEEAHREIVVIGN